MFLNKEDFFHFLDIYINIFIILYFGVEEKQTFLLGSYLNLSITTDVLSEMLEVNPNTIINWELSLGLDIKTNNSGIKVYSDELVTFFKKVKSLILNGYTLSSVKDLLILEVKYHNNVQVEPQKMRTEDHNNHSKEKVISNINESTVILLNDDKPDSSPQINKKIYETENFTDSDLKYTKEMNNNVGGENSFNGIKENGESNLNQPDMISLFEVLLKELKAYTDRTIEAEKKIFLLEDYERRVKEEYFEIKSEVKQLKVQLEDKNQKLKEFEEQKKRLNLMEVQLKIMQLSNAKKKFWEFWK
ncbi:MAG: hypothetical protein A2039_03700 [Candidatus Melainabacteria bacterium GWA2_34_9]|nr:MAG: hypothetical protein A2039_03700 [Candidatus Melainabacteria bacterium GWA2_34_9]